MANLSDQVVGGFLMVLSSAIFIYYTIWVIVLPFVNEDHLIHSLFLPRYYAMALPIAAGAVLILAIGVETLYWFVFYLHAKLGVFVTVVMVGEAARKRAKMSKLSQKKAQ